ncbi:hypothetical protein [Leuconostoc pseudomesenteroides]|uniref:hypothetical protein n=1 Tax=Leuconostoc pseudomesenteroides TaxID=33968 RepID=UPI0032DEA4B5
MNILISIIFGIMVGALILEYRHAERMRQSYRFMSYYAKLNENAKLHAQFKAETAAMLLRTFGYDVDRIVKGDSSRVIVSEEDKRVMSLEIDRRKRELDEHDKYFEQEKAKYEARQK